MLSECLVPSTFLSADLVNLSYLIRILWLKRRGGGWGVLMVANAAVSIKQWRILKGEHSILRHE